MTDQPETPEPDDQQGPSAGTDTGNAGEDSDADELFGDFAEKAGDDPGAGAD